MQYSKKKKKKNLKDCYRLYACVPYLQMYMLKSNPQCDGIWRLSLWEMIRL